MANPQLECSSPRALSQVTCFCQLMKFFSSFSVVGLCVCVFCCTRVSLFKAYNLLFYVQKCVHCLEV